MLCVLDCVYLSALCVVSCVLLFYVFPFMCLLLTLPLSVCHYSFLASVFYIAAFPFMLPFCRCFRVSFAFIVLVGCLIVNALVVGYVFFV